MWSLIGTALALLGTLGEDARLAEQKPDPSRRIMVLMDSSEHFGLIDYERERTGLTDQPVHPTPERVRGGVGQ